MELVDVLGLVKLSLTEADVARAAELMKFAEMKLREEGEHDLREIERELRGIRALSDAAANGFSLARNKISEVTASIDGMQTYTDDGRRSRAVIQVSPGRVF